MRISKDKYVDDIFDDLIKKKKLDIGRKNYIISAKIYGCEDDVELDPQMPLRIISGPYLKIYRREYEDR